MIKLTRNQKLILYSLGCFYQSLNQPLIEKPLQVRTSKITFIELLLGSGLISKKERALYLDLEHLEYKKLIEYDQRTVQFTEVGLRELQKIQKDLDSFMRIQAYFQHLEKPRRKLQTVMRQ